MVFTLEEVNIFDGKQTKLTSTHQPIIRRLQDPVTGLWQISIKNKQKDNSIKNTMPNHVHTSNKEEKVQQVYELPSTKQVIRYYHAAAGFPTKSTWIKAIKAGFYKT